MSKNSKWVIAVLAVVVFVAAAVAGFAANNNDSEEAAPTTTTSSTSTVPASTSTPTSAAPNSVDTTAAIWPFASSSTRYSDPKQAARSFAVDFAGFEAPVVGEFVQGDSRSGEVPVRPKSNGPVTTVLVRQLGTDNSWWIIGATTPNIQISEPTTLAKIASPVTLKGQSTAFEANVQTQVRQDGSVSPLGEGFVMGGSNGEIGPFTGTLNFKKPTATHGAVMLHTESAENGQVWEVAAVRVAF